MRAFRLLRLFSGTNEGLAWLYDSYSIVISFRFFLLELKTGLNGDSFKFCFHPRNKDQ